MFAIIATGGKQISVEVGKEYFIEKLVNENADEKLIIFNKVLMINDQIGTPYLPNAEVHAELIKHDKAKKIIVFKYKPKKNSKTKYGHRQPYTKIKITEIILDAVKAPKPEVKSEKLVDTTTVEKTNQTTKQVNESPELATAKTVKTVAKPKTEAVEKPKADTVKTTKVAQPKTEAVEKPKADTVKTTKVAQPKTEAVEKPKADTVKTTKVAQPKTEAVEKPKADTVKTTKVAQPKTAPEKSDTKAEKVAVFDHEKLTVKFVDPKKVDPKKSDK